MISIFSNMRHSIMRSVSKNNATKTLLFVAMAIVASGLLIGCPEPAGDSTAPNLAVTAELAQDSVGTGGTTTVTVTVTNSGTAASAATMVTLHRSATTTISATDDTKVGDAVAVDSIAAKGNMSRTFTIPASETGTAGTLNYGACIPAVGGSTAKCSTAVSLTVTAAPDLSVSGAKVTISPDGPYATTTTVRLRVRVTNSGAAASTDGTVSFYRVAGTEINREMDGEAVGTAPISMLDPGQGTTSISSTFALGTTGTAVQYYAVVSGVTGEDTSATANNTSMLSDGITIGTPPDLDVSDVSVILNAASYEVGNTATISVVITNRGDTTSTPNTRVRFRRLAGASPNKSADTEVTDTAFRAIPAGESETVRVNFTISSVGTDVRYYAVVDQFAPETNNTNNTSMPSNPITITAADLEITAFTATPNPVTVGNSVMASVTIANNGNAASKATTVSFDLYNFGGSLLHTSPITGTITVPAINAGENSGVLTQMITIPADTTPHGVWNLRARVVSVANEENTANNTRALAGDFTVNGTIDLEIASFTTVSNVASVTAGGTFSPVVRVYNRGTVSSEATTVSFALVNSAGTVVQTLDGTISVSAVPNGMNRPASSDPITIPIATDAGTYHLRATIAPPTGETTRDNNDYLLGGTPSSTNFVITAPRETVFNLATGCLVLIGNPDCGVARTADLAMGDRIGTVVSTDATAFTAQSNEFFIDNSGVVTADEDLTLASLTFPTVFGVRVTGGVGAGLQRVRIINDPRADGLKRDVTAQLGAAIPTGATLFRPTTSTSRTFACSDQGGGCITSLQTGNQTFPSSFNTSSAAAGWRRPYNSGVTGDDALDVSDYSTIYIEYHLNNNTISPAPQATFHLRLGYTYYWFGTSSLVANSEWQTLSMSLSRDSNRRGTFDPRYVSNIGFVRQGVGVELSVRAVYFR